jgi:hypothetical protein
MVERLQVVVAALRTAYPSASSPYWRSLPLQRLGRLLAGSFLLTSVAGFGVNLLFAGHPLLHGLLWPLLIASISTAVLLVRLRKPRWLSFVIFFGIVVSLLAGRFEGSPVAAFNDQEIRPELFFDALGIWIGIGLGSRLVMSFLTTEGVGSVRMQTELAMAHSIQSTLVPPISLTTPRFELYGVSIPSTEMGGDIVDAVQRNGNLLAYVADVSGHGLPAGQLMGMLKTAVRVSLDLCKDPVRILENADRVLPAVKQPHMYAALALLHFDHASHKAEYALAGHGPILQYRKFTNDVVRLQMQQLPLGLLPGTSYCTASVIYSPGDLFVILTDGIVEVANEKNEELGLKRVEALIAGKSAEPLENLWDAIHSEAAAHGPQNDDQSGLLIRVLK